MFCYLTSYNIFMLYPVVIKRREGLKPVEWENRQKRVPSRHGEIRSFLPSVNSFFSLSRKPFEPLDPLTSDLKAPFERLSFWTATMTDEMENSSKAIIIHFTLKTLQLERLIRIIEYFLNKVCRADEVRRRDRTRRRLQQLWRSFNSLTLTDLTFHILAFETSKKNLRSRKLFLFCFLFLRKKTEGKRKCQKK